MARRINISNGDDIIDSRDVIEKIEQLQEELDGGEETEEGFMVNGVDMTEEQEELTALLALAEEAEGCADWHHGEALIRDSHFERWAREFADDIGAIDSNASWPQTCIDWKQAAEELQQDYTSVDFDGVTYWIRS
jgi:hypothetical protein